jgi:hypothetical protein
MPEPTYRRASDCSESACVEVALPAGYRKADGCGSGSCVEVNRDYAHHDLVLVRDSKDPPGVRLSFTVAEWQAFIRGVKEGQFDV